jgi:hypothetical protein
MIRTKGNFFIFFCFAAICLAVGCATTKKITKEITKDITGRGGSVKKKIALLPATNKMGYESEGLAQLARTHFKSALEGSCDDLVISDSEQIRNLLAEVPLLSSGRIDNLALADVGKALGLNAVLDQSPSTLKCATDKRGIWGFRDTRMLVQLSVSVRGYDILTGAILFEEVVHNEVEVPEHEWKSIMETGGYNEDVVNQLLAKIMPEASEKVCEIIGNESWKGYVTSITGNTFTLTAGRDVGLAEGDELEVFGMGELIRCNAGQSYLVSGPKIGELTITNVRKNQADATGDLEVDPQKISHVKFK